MSTPETNAVQLQEELTATKNQVNDLQGKVEQLTIEKTKLEEQLAEVGKKLKKAEAAATKASGEVEEAKAETEKAKAEVFKVRESVKESETSGNSLTFQKPKSDLPTGHGTFKHGGDTYLITAANFRFGGTIVAAAHLATDKEMQAELLKIKAGFITKIEG